MDYWWLGITQLMESIIPNLPNLESLSLRLSHVITSRLSQAISKLEYLHTLRIQLKDVALGPHVSCIKGLRHLELDLAPPPPGTTIMSPVVETSFRDMVSLLENSVETLQTLALYSHDPVCTAGFVHNMDVNKPLQTVLKACQGLKALSVHMEIKDTASALNAVDSLIGFPVTALHLRCKPAMFPDVPSEGYGIGLDVLKRICMAHPLIEDLKLEDGEVGKRNLARPADGHVFVRGFPCVLDVY
jgi:hypothetical protein